MPGIGDMLMDMFPDVGGNYIPGDLTWAVRDYGLEPIMQGLQGQSQALENQRQWDDRMQQQGREAAQRLQMKRGELMARDKDRELTRQKSQAELDKAAEQIDVGKQKWKEQLGLEGKKISAKTKQAKAKLNFDIKKFLTEETGKENRSKRKAENQRTLEMMKLQNKNKQEAQKQAYKKETAILKGTQQILAQPYMSQLQKQQAISKLVEAHKEWGKFLRVAGGDHKAAMKLFLGWAQQVEAAEQKKQAR